MQHNPFKPNGVIPCGAEGFFAYQQTGPAIHSHPRRNPVEGVSYGRPTYARLMVGFRTNRKSPRFSGVPEGEMVGIKAVVDVLNWYNFLGAGESGPPVGYTVIPQLGSYVPQEYKGIPVKDIPPETVEQFGEPGAQVVLFPDGDKDLHGFFLRTNRVGFNLLAKLDQIAIIAEMVAKGVFVCTGAWIASEPLMEGSRSGIDFAGEATKAGITNFDWD